MNDPVVEAQSLISATRQVHVKRRLIQFMQSIDVSILPVRYQRNQRKGSKCCLLMVRFFELLFFCVRFWRPRLHRSHHGRFEL